jgi:hypothetical protein
LPLGTACVHSSDTCATTSLGCSSFSEMRDTAHTHTHMHTHTHTHRKTKRCY